MPGRLHSCERAPADGGRWVVTYVSPVFEPHRGFPQFMSAAALIQQQRPLAHIVLVGMERGKGYGRNPKADQPSWLKKMLGKYRFDAKRLHLVGPLPYQRMLRVMQISSAHVYLTVPFVLSWSVLEAMAAGCLVVGSNTDPVRKVIQHEHNGLLVDFFSAEAIADTVVRALKQSDDFVELRNCARDTVLERYSLDKVMPLHMALIDDLAAGLIPPPAHQAIEALQQQQT